MPESSTDPVFCQDEATLSLNQVGLHVVRRIIPSVVRLRYGKVSNISDRFECEEMAENEFHAKASASNGYIQLCDVMLVCDRSISDPLPRFCPSRF